MEMSNLEKLDFAFNETLTKFRQNHQEYEYMQKFIEDFCINGYKPSLFTRTNGAREVSSMLNTEIILVEMIKYANRARAISLEQRYDGKLYQKYPFLGMLGISTLDYVSYNENNLKNVVTFFLDQRYADYSDYKKEKTDRPEVFASCHIEDKKIDNFFGISVHQR